MDNLKKLIFIYLLVSLTLISCGFKKIKLDPETEQSNRADNAPPLLSNLSSDSTPRKSKTWTWRCSESECTYRYIIDQHSDTSPSGEYGPNNSATQGSGDGTYYIHVQAKDSLGNESDILHVSAVLDNTAPVPPGGLSLSSYVTNNASSSPLFSWLESSDTDISSYKVSLGTTSGEGNIVDMISSLGSTSHTFINLSLSECESYYPSVFAVDNAGNMSSLISSSLPFIYDGISPDAITSVTSDYYSLISTQGTLAAWSAPNDNCGLINYYEMGIGTNSGGSDITQGWLNIGNITSYQPKSGVDGFNFSLELYTNYYTSVRSLDMAGNISSITSGDSWQIAPRIISHGNHSCALLNDGSVKCWGYNFFGQLGLGDGDSRGDGPGEMGDSLPTVDLGTNKKAKQLTTGDYHSCALLNDGSVKCWGDSYYGQLGIGDDDPMGDDPGEMGDVLSTVDLGTNKKAKQLTAGDNHTCALLNDGSIKCWGYNNSGRLGLGNTDDRGDQTGEMGDSLPTVDLGTNKIAKQLALGGRYSCALLNNGSVKCWGYNNYGQLGLGDTDNRGDQTGEMGDSLPTVDLGTNKKAKQLALGSQHSCALLNDGSIKCWGYNNYGQLGLGDTDDRGDQPGEMGDSLPTVDLGTNKTVTQLALGCSHSCALLNDGSIKCWGYNNYGQLGLGDTDNRGDQTGEMGDSLPTVDLGTNKTVTQLALGCSYSCALLNDGSVKCWGYNFFGQLGLGDGDSRGDGPGEMGDSLPTVDIIFIDF